MRQGILPGAVHALLFATEKHEANRAPRHQSCGLDGARCFDHQRCIATIVKGAGAQVPGIEARAKDDSFVRLLVSTDFAAHVFLLPDAPELGRLPETPTPVAR